jgi:hypothetical protein
MNDDSGLTPRPDQTAELETALIADFLARRGYTLQSVHALPDPQAQALLREASLYASTRLTEVESRAHYVDELHEK